MPTHSAAQSRREWQDFVSAELKAMTDALAAGFDVAPARRLHLEGALETGLRAGWLSEQEADALCAAALPAPHGALIEAGRVQLLLWQERAPVWPTTGD